MERYFLIDKELASRAALDENLRTEIEGKLLLSEKDIRNITLTIDEKVTAMGGIEYIEPEIEPEEEDVEEVEEVEPEIIE